MYERKAYTCKFHWCNKGSLSQKEAAWSVDQCLLFKALGRSNHVSFPIKNQMIGTSDPGLSQYYFSFQFGKFLQP